jgi:RNA 2',3'-cyclic 3'-phosphodiesterase
VDGVSKKDQAKSNRVRLFVALDLPRSIRQGIADWGEAELTDPGLRPVPADNLHITVAFLGQRPARDAQRVAEAIEQCVGAAPLVELLDPAPRPARGRPRLFALPALSPGAEQLQSQLSKILISERLLEPEKRPFWPHVTVARIRAEGRGSRRPIEVEKFPGELPSELSQSFYAIRVVLYRSELQPSGARYVPLARVKLPGAGGSEVI